MTAAGCFRMRITLYITLENKNICFIRTIFTVYIHIYFQVKSGFITTADLREKHYYTIFIHAFSDQEVNNFVFLCVMIFLLMVSK